MGMEYTVDPVQYLLDIIDTNKILRRWLRQ